MKAYYVQKAAEIFPVYGVNSVEEAREFVVEDDWTRIVETADSVYMNPSTGSVDFATNWTAEGVDLDDLAEVELDAETGSWVVGK